MDLLRAVGYEPPPGWRRLRVIDSHTGGEPFRVVIEGVGDIPGDTVLERREYAMTELDAIRKLLMWEPRGHADMYGGIVGPPTRDDSDLSVLFIHNEGFSTMCGHGIIALTKVVLDTGILEVVGDRPTIRIDTPAGQIRATSTVVDGKVAATTFTNVASFAAGLDLQVETGAHGVVTFDLAYGGAFYAYVDARSIGLSLDDPAALIAAGKDIKRSLADSPLLHHPESDDLGFLYGVIFSGQATSPDAHSRNVCVFADGEIDRSPTGTGVSGRLAIGAARGEFDASTPVTIESIVGSTFEGRIAGETSVGDFVAVIPEVTGTAHITGRSEYWIDPGDEIGRGFLVR